jgi:hypothetical protein
VICAVHPLSSVMLFVTTPGLLSVSNPHTMPHQSDKPDTTLFTFDNPSHNARDAKNNYFIT